MAPETLRMAIVGSGGDSADILAALGEIRDEASIAVAAIATPDRTDPRLRAELESLGSPVTLYRRFEELLAGEVLQVVCVASPLPLRHAHAKAALCSGCHVLVKTPLALTVRSGARTVQAALESNRLLAVCHSNRFSRKAHILRWAVTSRVIGKLRYVLDIAFGAAGISPNLCCGGDPKLHDRAHGGGMLLVQAVQDLALIRFVCGDVIEVAGHEVMLEPERIIRPEGGRVEQRFACHAEDTMAAHLRFANGAAGQYLRSWGGTGLLLEPRFRAWGSLGAVENGTLFLEEPYDLEEAWKERVGPGEIERLFPRGITNPLALEILAFSRAVPSWEAGTKIDPPHAGRDALRDLATAWALAEAHREARRLSVAEVENLSSEGAQKDLNARWGIT
jgi:predicted dehydrogenase